MNPSASFYYFSQLSLETTEEDLEDWRSSCVHVHDDLSKQISVDASVAAVLLELDFILILEEE